MKWKTKQSYAFCKKHASIFTFISAVFCMYGGALIWVGWFFFSCSVQKGTYGKFTSFQHTNNRWVSRWVPRVILTSVRRHLLQYFNVMRFFRDFFHVCHWNSLWAPPPPPPLTHWRARTHTHTLTQRDRNKFLLAPLPLLPFSRSKAKKRRRAYFEWETLKPCFCHYNKGQGNQFWPCFSL